MSGPLRLLRLAAVGAAALLALGLLACSSAAPPAPAPAAAPAAEPPLPLDPAVVAGRLPNGVRYFVRANREPRERAELWLALDAGSLQEDPDQRGLAHFVEHMAFNGTERFPKQELVDYLERLGIRFGADLNASTSFDQTVYTLTVPTDRPELLSQGLDVLHEWACCIAFAAEEVERERGVVVEEWRLGRGAAARVRDRQLPVLWRGSRYAERLPIGRREVIESATAELLRRFYRDWYRPDLMTVVAVGDFDPRALEAEIRARFATLAPVASPRPRLAAPVPGHSETLAEVTSDAELTVASASLSIKAPAEPLATASAYRRSLARGLFAAMVNARLDELRRAAAPPFVAAAIGHGAALRTASTYRLAVTAAPERLLAGFATAAAELERVRRHGFSEGELERQKARLLRAYENAYAERERTESAALAAELVDHALEGEAAPGIERELALVRELLPAIDRAEVEGAGSGWFGAENRVLLASGPEREGVALPAAEALLAELAAAATREVAPYDDRVAAGPLVESPPAPGAVVAESRIAELGLVDWRLGNGVRVLLKPTDFKQDEVLLTGFRPGGHSNVADADFLSASYATAVLGEGGLGRFDAVALRKRLAGKLASAGAALGELEERLSGSASPRDLETMFELVYLSATSPRSDAAAVASWRERQRTLLENRLLQPQAVFADAVARALYGEHPRRQPPRPQDLERIDLAAAERLFRARFSDFSGFVFVLVGAFEPAAIRPLVERWLGGLPASGAESTWRDVGVVFPSGVRRVEVAKGLEPKAAVQLLFHGEAPFSRDEQHLIGALAEALEIELREALREEAGGTYGVGVSGGLSDRPRPRYSFTVNFGCDPARVDELLGDFWTVLARFEGEGPRPATVAKVQEARRREREVALRENRFWLGSLATYLRQGWDPRDILRHEELVASLSPERLATAARRYADRRQVLLAILRPEGP